VVYRVDGRAMTPTLNEKVMAGLGRGVGATGRLAPEGVETALRAMRRFKVLVDSLGVRDVFAVGTAAVREADDGRAFAEKVKRESGFDLRILSGADEARLSALGVQAGAPDADGVVGDLGGASLELIEIGSNGPGNGETFKVGPLALMRGEGFEYGRVAGEVDAALANAGGALTRGGDFYAVGGAWRAIGRIDMALRNHPLGVLHFHEMSRSEVLTVTEVVRKQSRKSLEKLEETAARRADTLPYAAVVLERVMLAGSFTRVVISALGLREGVLVERMSAEALKADPLVAAAEAIAGRSPRTRDFGRALERWIAPMFEGQEAAFTPARDAALRSAAARLADIGGLFHPDQRIEIMFDLVLRAPLTALSHYERAFLAAAIHHRYTKSAPKHADAFYRLLSEERRKAAAALGAALRLGADLSGRSEGLLAKCEISAKDGALVLKVSRKVEHLLTEQAVKRFEAAASALSLAPRVTLD
jgi:exopolyphosphatase/guanosine-5'-triphosphate,3'-diphosphate pyrophosphatase